MVNRFQTDSYIPGYTDPKSISGVTIGLGVDFGGGLITTATLATLFTSAWANNPNLKFLADSIGDRGQRAVADLQKGDTQTYGSSLGSLSVSLTESEANALSSIAEAATYSALQNAYYTGSGTPFTSLQPGEQTALMDMAFNFGLSTVRPGLRSFTFWGQAIQNTAASWEQAYDNLILWGGKAELYSRRIAEAKLIAPYVANPRLAPEDIPYTTRKNGTTVYNFADVKNAYYHVDPPGDGTYTLIEDAGSPFLASMILPAEDAESYRVQYESGGTWSAPQLASPLQEISFPQNVNAIQVTLLDASGTPIVNPTDFSFFVSFGSDGTFSGTVTEPNASCFGKGTLIATSLGPRQVEALRVDDLVLVERPGKPPRVETIRWVGHRRMHLSSRSDAVLNAPVRIRAGAIGPNRPSRDLILSPDHCIYVGGHLLRAYRLINGVSVVQEFPRAIDYYHVETERHGLVFAEGLAVETYLEEDCSTCFPSRYARSDRQPDKVRQAACAPPAPDDGFAERAWRAVAQRAGVGMPEARRAPKPDVTLIAGKRRIRPTVHRKDRITFAVPPGCSDIRLLSPAARPNEARPWLEDRRLLGLNVRNLRIDAGDALPLDSDAIGQGWWPMEPGLSRWTDGDACVRLPATARLLDVLLQA